MSGTTTRVQNVNLAAASLNPDVISSGTISALYVNDSTVGGSLRVAVPAGYRSATIYIKADDTFTGSVAMKCTADSGTSYQTMQGLSLTSTSTPINGFTYAGTTTYFPAKFNIPGGTTHVAVQCTAFTSGSCVAYVVLSTESVTTTTTGIAVLSSSAARVGNVGLPGTWYTDTSAALAGGASFTSTARDMTSAVSGTASTSGILREYRVSVAQDVAFTLYLEVSTDNSTFRRIKQVAGAQNVTAGLYIAEIVEAPKWRYYRYVIVNGAGAAAHTTGCSMVVG